jgi:hypothetical protein
MERLLNCCLLIVEGRYNVFVFSPIFGEGGVKGKSALFDSFGLKEDI